MNRNLCFCVCHFYVEKVQGIDGEVLVRGVQAGIDRQGADSSDKLFFFLISQDSFANRCFFRNRRQSGSVRHFAFQVESVLLEMKGNLESHSMAPFGKRSLMISGKSDSTSSNQF
jgi:hypothetical protein